MEVKQLKELIYIDHDSTKSPKSPKIIKIDEILESSEYLQSFMVHLSHEFSMEILLSLIEFIQYKQFCIQTS